MKTYYNLKSLWIGDKKRPTASDSQTQDERLRALSQWLLIFPIVMLILFSCGQIGILTSSKIAESTIQTNMEANYEPWSYVLIHPIRQDIVDEIIHDKPKEEGEIREIPSTIEGNTSWADSTPNVTAFPPAEPTTTPTVQGSHQTLPTDTPQQNPSPLPTRTPTQIIATSTTVPPTAPVDHSPTPTNTTTEIPTTTVPPSPSNSPSSTETITFWMSGESPIRRYKLVTSQPNGPPRQVDMSVTFTTDPFADGSSIEAGTSSIYFFATNPSDQSMTMGIMLEAGEGHRSFPIGGTEMTIPPNTTSPTFFEKSFPTIGYNLATNGILKLTMVGGVHVTIYWDGEWNDSRLVVPPITP
jgi:hypothetical protein